MRKGHVAVGSVVVVVVVVGLVVWRMRATHHAPRAPAQPTVDLAVLAPLIGRGLDNDFFFLPDAEPLDLLKRRGALFTPASDDMPAADRAKRLGEAYTFVVGEVEALLRTGNPDLQRLIDEDIINLRVAAARGGDGLGLDMKRFDANLGFWGAVAWLFDQQLPDRKCLMSLRACASGPCDYAEPARRLLAKLPTDDPYGEALAAVQRGDLAAASTYFDRAITRDPRDSSALAWRGMLRLRAEDAAKALADFDRAIAVDPNEPTALEGRGHALYRLGRKQEAVAAWQHATTRLPDRAPWLREFIRVAGAGS
jgi:tetratricopeptide (TPR) repeat protein